MSSADHNHDGETADDDVLDRADALLNRHRAAVKPPADADAFPVLTEAIAGDLDAAAIPTLTDIVAAPVPATVETPAPPSAPVASAPPGKPPQSGEIISRVQVQNIEHGVYLKLKQGLDDQIVDVLQNRFMPDVAGALDQALRKISDDLKADINAMVRVSIEETLHHQLAQLRLTDESRPGPSAVAAEVSAIMPGFSAPPAAKMELAKSFEPRARACGQGARHAGVGR